MKTYDDTWLVVPLYNEKTVISQVISEARQVFPNIVCIDDGSTDGSGAVARAAGAVVTTHPINLGQGAALQTGFDFVLRYTNARFVATFDADGQHSIDDVVAMRQAALDEDLSFVFGSRFLDGAKREMTGLKALVLRTAALVTRLQTGLKLTDAHNGLRLIRRDALEQIHLHQDRMAHASEIVEQLAKTSLPWKEMPVNVRYTDYSRSKGQSLLNSVNILVELVMK
ncbi:glycosyltransferase family 2 protein [Schaalia sp. ZJ405]|uniref:glycosyltransferase family 2 protein n=1 Tax=Schaalia sp. ZJ405 TaxID=2709403 RepID=UPI0013EA6F51|nr:glycosyltransferase family 2 protein [Schaalia sp. ZJ405]QPK81697.1 glycosyltransferase family 2 protein [Schaalia sp. ZJ405]